jgi:hypothetical protein
MHSVGQLYSIKQRTVQKLTWILTVAAAPNEERRFFSFHDWGVSVYEPTACRLYHQIQATDIIPGTQVTTEP